MAKKSEITKLLILKFILVSFALLTGCSTMFNSSAQPVRVIGKDNAKIVVTASEGSYESSLPTTIVTKSSWRPVTIEIIDDRYEPTKMVLGRSIATSFWANIFNCGLGAIIDLTAGSLWDYDYIVNVQVTKKNQAENLNSNI